MTSHTRWALWFSGRMEPELDALYEWMDTQRHRAGDWRAGVLGGTLGPLWGFVGAAIGVMVGGFQLPVAWISIPIGVGVVGTAAMVAWYVRGRSAEDRHHAKLLAEAKGVMQRLTAARWLGKLKDTLGQEAALSLNSGAKQWLRCKSSLDMPVWKAASPGSPWRQGRDQALRAMDLAMAQLLLIASASSYSANHPSNVSEIVEDMTRMADEACTLTEKLAARTGRSSGDPRSDLRRALGELRSLTAAEEEFERAHEET
jgi:hypothetical protein